MRLSRWCAWVGAVAALMATAPASAQTVAKTIDAAIAARAAGDYPRAIMLLEAADSAEPDQPTTLRLLGTTYAFARRYPKAIETLTHAHNLAPNDSDISLALARAWLWSGDSRKARAIADALAANDPANGELPDLVRLIDRARRGEPGTTPGALIAVTQSVAGVDVGGIHRTWYETVATLAVPLSRQTTLSGEIDHEDRAVAVDTRLQLRVDRRFANQAAGYLAVAGTPGASFRERWSVRTGGEISVARPLSLTLDLRYADYGPTTIVVVEPGVSLHTRDDRYALAVKSINLWGEARSHQNGWSIRAEAQPHGAVRLYAGAATYPDTEAGITRRDRSAFVGATLPVASRLSVRLTYEYENRASSYTRNSVIFGASWRL